MIKKAFLSAFIFIILHFIFVFTVVRPSRVMPQTQWQDNIIRAQHFLYTDLSPNIILGSSLSTKISMTRLPRMYNMSLAGESIFDGLNILSHKKNLPGNVFIEMNNVLKSEDPNFCSLITDPILRSVRETCPSFQTEYQPVSLLVSLYFDLTEIVKRAMPDNLPAVEDKNLSIRNNQLAADLFIKRLNLEAEEYSQRPDQKLIDESFNHLKKYVTELEEKGVDVIFFEMPVNPVLCGSPKARIIRETFYSYFSPSKYKYISMPDCSFYVTADGIHLNPYEAYVYTDYFRTQAGNYIH